MKVIISGGGTGGHIFPAVSIANAIRRHYPEADILFVGAEGRMEMERVPAAGYKIEGLPVAGFDRKRLWRNIKVVAKLLRCMRRARRIIRDFRPDIVVGVGGYASGPVLKAAQQMGIPTLLQEQNSYAGVTNKLLAKKAGRICVAYEGLERFFPADKIVLTGNPVRDAILHCPLSQSEAKQQLGFDPQRPLVLVVGGSLGARTINSTICDALPQIADSGIQMLWQTGKNDAERWAAAAADIPSVSATTFISDMATAYAAADLVVSRAGAGTISELQLLGKAVVLVPSPNVAEDHQRRNAEALSTRDAAVMILDADAHTDLIAAIFDLIADEPRRQRLSRNISQMALRDSDEKILANLLELIPNKQ